MASARLQMEEGGARSFNLITSMRSLVRWPRSQAKSSEALPFSERVFMASSSAMLPVLFNDSWQNGVHPSQHDPHGVETPEHI